MGMELSLQKNGEKGRYNITIPKTIAKTKGWEKGDKFEITDMGGGSLRVTKK